MSAELRKRLLQIAMNNSKAIGLGGKPAQKVCKTNIKKKIEESESEMSESEMSDSSEEGGFLTRKENARKWHEKKSKTFGYDKVSEDSLKQLKTMLGKLGYEVAQSGAHKAVKKREPTIYQKFIKWYMGKKTVDKHGKKKDLSKSSVTDMFSKGAANWTDNKDEYNRQYKKYGKFKKLIKDD